MCKASELPRDILKLWNRLALAHDHPDPVCCSPDWQLAWLETAKPQSRLIWSASGESLAIFAMDSHGSQSMVLWPPESGWCFGCNLLGYEAPGLLESILDYLSLRLRGVPVFSVLGGIAEEGEQIRSIGRYFGSFCHFRLLERNKNMTASLAGSLDGWLGRRSGNCRAKLKKALLAGKKQEIVFERHIPAEEEVDLLYQRMLAIERKSWKGIQNCGITESPSREFYHALIKRLARRGGCRVIFATRNGEDVGYIFGSTLGKIYRGQQFSYAQSLAALSLGNQLQYQTVAWLCEDGFERYDMGPGDSEKMAYKVHWAEQPQAGVVLLMKPRFILA